MISPVFTGKVEHGKLILKNPDMFDAHVRSLEGDVNLTIKRHRKDRSNRQNKYYWGVVIQILSDAWGWEDPEELHEAIKIKFLLIEDRPLKSVKSTASLSTVEFEDLMTRIRVWAQSEHNIRIPAPNEVEFE
jgi:hypothetical protein